MRRFVLVPVAAVAALLVLFSGSGIALASGLPESVTRPPKPTGGAYTWGASYDQLRDNCLTDGPLPKVGGWDESNVFVTDTAYYTDGSTTKRREPTAVGLPEPCWSSASRLSVDVMPRYFGGGDKIGSPIKHDYPGMAAGTWSTAVCQPSEWSTSRTVVGTQLGGNLSPQLASVPMVTAHNDYSYLSVGGVDKYNCPYVQAIKYTLCWQDNLGTLPGSDGLGYACKTTYWTAENWATDRAYLSSDSADVALCKFNADLNSDCPYILPPGYIDPAKVCDNPPEMAWLDFSWIPATIGHYARCLFVPAGGWDSAGHLNTAIELSPLVQIYQITQSLLGAVAFNPGQCGVLFDASGVKVGTVAVLPGFSLDTCTWGAWVGPTRTFLGVVVLVLSSFYMLTFVYRTTLSVASGLVPNPFEDEDSK